MAQFANFTTTSITRGGSSWLKTTPAECNLKRVDIVCLFGLYNVKDDKMPLLVVVWLYSFLSVIF